MFYHLARYIKLKNFFILFSLDNDDMESSKRCVKLFSLIFILRWWTFQSKKPSMGGKTLSGTDNDIFWNSTISECFITVGLWKTVTTLNLF